jgi:serine/threonine-protein kinase
MLDQKLLYVDDEENNRSLFEMEFGQLYGLHLVDSGEAALEVMAKKRIDVIVTDQRMPGMTGTELLRVVRSLYPETVRMILTGYLDVDLLLESVNTGLASRFVVKPFALGEFRPIVAWGMGEFARRSGSQVVSPRKSRPVSREINQMHTQSLVLIEKSNSCYDKLLSSLGEFNLQLMNGNGR